MPRSATQLWSAVLTVAAVFAVTACGGLPSAEYPLPDDPDAVVISYTGYYGEADIVDMYVTADGRVFRSTWQQSGTSMTVGGEAFLYPMTWETFDVAPQTVADAFAMAHAIGLLGEVKDPYDVTDTSSTLVRLVTDTAEFSNTFVALGTMDERGIRADVEAYGVGLGQLLADGALGDVRRYEPDLWLVDVGYAYPDRELDPWPLETPPERGCVSLDPADFPNGLPGAYTDGEYRDGESDEDPEVVSIEVVFPWTRCR
ncbi:MAG: hypothetical protein ACK5H2_13490 [Beutenbergiaceae bacterium]